MFKCFCGAKAHFFLPVVFRKEEYKVFGFFWYCGARCYLRSILHLLGL